MKKENYDIQSNINTVHLHEPDYSNELLDISESKYNKILERLEFLYGKNVALSYLPEIMRILKVHYSHKTDFLKRKVTEFDQDNRFSEKDIILITYGDLLKGKEKSPLATLSKFCDIYLEGSINTIHILPFYPYSSDRGFSIIDFETVDPKLGTWEDIEKINHKYQLMFDGVINHVSSKSRWFQEFLNGNPHYNNFFISYNSPDDLTPEQRRMIFRPRTSDILSKFSTIHGDQYVWTTFSEDQIDLNYKNPEVLLRVLEILLLYVRHGASIIRLDAVTYIWAEPGTRCVHLDQTHEIVKLFHDILTITDPNVAIITETNVPHKENISYFGNGSDEAQMVYNFALPPLVLYTFYSQNSTELSKWASTLQTGSLRTTFFNFLDSHDGVGLMAVKDILTQKQIDFIVKKAEEHGGYISYKTTNDGKEPYEINITWFSAINKEDYEDIAFQVKKFVASRAVALVLPGVPGIYLHSLLGTVNDIEAVLLTNSKRDINRTVIDANAISFALGDGLSKISRINRELGRIISLRTKHPAFHPNGPQKVLNYSDNVFSVLRSSTDNTKHVLSLINVSSQVTHIDIDLSSLSLFTDTWYDIVSETYFSADNNIIKITLQPYDISWLIPEREDDGTFIDE